MNNSHLVYCRPRIKHGTKELTNEVMVVDDQRCQENSEMSDKDIATQHRRKIEISKRRKLIKFTREEDRTEAKKS